MKELTITYQDYIPDELIRDFRKLVQSNELQIKVSKKEREHSDGRWNNFETVAVNDIIVYINQHPTELIINFISDSVFLLIVTGIKQLWVNISKPSVQKIGRGKGIELKIRDVSKSIDVSFSGDVNEKQADLIIESFVDYLKSKNVNNAFDNPDYVNTKSDKPEIHLIYDKEEDIWEPENFGEQKRKMEELRRHMQRNFKN